MLTYGCSADIFDETIRLEELLSMAYLYRFAAAIVDRYSLEFLRAPTQEDTEVLLKRFIHVQFLEMLGSIDSCKQEVEELSDVAPRILEREGKIADSDVGCHY